MSIEDIKKHLANISASGAQLTEFEDGFVKSVGEQIERWGDMTRITGKQEAVIQKIADKAAKHQGAK